VKLLLTATALLLLQDKVELRWRFEKGQTLVYKSTRKDLRTAGGRASETDLSSTFSWTVSEVASDGTAAVDAKFLAVSFFASQPAPYEYDSEKDKTPPPGGPGATLARLVGQTFTLRVSPRGRVTEVKGFDRIAEAMAKDLPEGAAGEAGRQAIKQAFSDEAFRAAMDQMSSSLPDGPVGIGDAWPGEFKTPMPGAGTLQYALASRLADLRDGDARIDQELRIEFKPEGAAPVSIRDAKGKAVSVFSARRGRFLSQKSSLEMTVSREGREMKVETDTEVRLLDRTSP
jgi:hypothetical protein